MSDWPTDQETNDERPPTSKPKRSWAGKVGSFLLMQLLAFVVLVGFPAGWTAAAPVSWIKFERRDGQVSASVKTCLLFVIPYRVKSISPVTGFDDRFLGGTTSYDSKRPHRQSVKSEDQAYLTIQSPDQQFEVPVTPHDIDSVKKKSEAFLNDPQATELKLFVVANWKFSVFGGGVISLLAVLYVGSLAFGVVLKTIHGVQWLCGVPPGRRWLVKAIKNAERANAARNR